MLTLILRTFYGRHHDFVDRYGICVTKDHGYTLPSPFLIHDLLPGFVTGLTQRMPLVEQECPLFRTT
jgi:hypothetical protein